MNVVSLIVCALAMGSTYLFCRYLDLKYNMKTSFHLRYKDTEKGTWLKIAMGISVGIVFVLSTYLPETNYSLSKVPVAVAFMAFAYFIS